MNFGGGQWRPIVHGIASANAIGVCAIRRHIKINKRILWCPKCIYKRLVAINAVVDNGHIVRGGPPVERNAVI